MVIGSRAYVKFKVSREAATSATGSRNRNGHPPCDNDNILELPSHWEHLKHLPALHYAIIIHHFPLGHDNHTSVSSVTPEPQFGPFRMASNSYAIQNGIANGSNSTSPMNGSQRRRSRVLTVDEALAYSPFSSVVPFNSGRFTFPPKPFI
jgi:hypothetical protein